MKPKRVSEGFRYDANQLFNKVLSYESNALRFSTFANVWKEMKFSFIFYGRISENESRELIEEIYDYLLTQLSIELPLQRRVNGLYMLYSIFVKQPLIGVNRLRVKIRMTFEHFQMIRHLINVAKNDRHYDVCYIWYKLNSYGGIDYVDVPRPVGPSYIRNARASSDDKITSEDSLFNNLRFSIVPQLDELIHVNELYCNMKAAAAEGTNQQQNDELKAVNLVNDHIFQSFKTDLNNLKKEFRSDIINDNDSKCQISPEDKPNDDIGNKRRRIKEKAMAASNTSINKESDGNGNKKKKSKG